ncbi:sodium channel protein Nach [Cimex lectularius]|uniref:Sodium channel protein Nach n=1 Tax=Cimex lectularius TaxID=79782 RepID=A0A8I6RH95_CIMLE|nr:sodium channel protein Nach [Cimex lectularius]XP_014242026.1 sodium channel protein Nach [Cimex lectularius]XP_014242028.1 sodium channel protein Nach [Cimex lectularius]
MESILHTIRNYFTNTSFHGFRFVGQPGRHWSERILWAVLCMLSWVGSAILINASWYAFQNHAVSFMVETTYLKENSTFPAISVCEDDNMGRIYEAAAVMFGEDHDCNLDEVLKEITFFKGTAYYIKEFCTSGDIECPLNDYSSIAERVRSSCKDLFDTCFWMGKEIDCCKHFMPLNTELGTCFSFNQMNERKLFKMNDPEAINTETNRKTGLPKLVINLKGATKVYLHSENDVPFYNTMTTDTIVPVMNMVKNYSITVTDTENPAGVRDLTVHQRKCRFGDENYLKSADYYSYSACVVECRRQEQLRHCNCTSHLMPKSDPAERCNITGLLCLNNNYVNLSVQKTPWGKKDGLICDCFPNCNEPEINTITVLSDYIDDNVSSLEVAFFRFPSERFKRNVVRSHLDLVVSMGGAAGLFVGASLLSFVEILYFFILRSKTELDGEEEKKENTNKLKTLEIRAKPLPLQDRNTVITRNGYHTSSNYIS